MSKEESQKDMEFLKEMQDRLDKSVENNDPTQLEFVRDMISHWIDELNQFENNALDHKPEVTYYPMWRYQGDGVAVGFGQPTEEAAIAKLQEREDHGLIGDWCGLKIKTIFIKDVDLRDE